MSAPLPVIVLFLFTGVSAHPPTSGDVVTPRMRYVKTDALLSKILSEVNLLEPPFIDGPITISPNIVDLLENREAKESAFANGENLVATPSNENTNCFNETFCSRYEFELNLENKPLSSIHIWFWKMAPDDEIDMSVCWITAIETEKHQMCEHLKNISEVKSVLDWGVYDLSSKRLREYTNKQLFCTVKIFGPSMEEHGLNQKPFLVASMNSTATTRKRRSASTGSKNCSLADFYVSFTQIGWYRVVAPSGFNAYMCTGKCSNQINSYPSYHHQVLGTILNNRSSLTDEEDLWSPCCSPTKLSPLNMIYVAGNNTNTNSSSYSLVHHKIKNMITESCGCW